MCPLVVRQKHMKEKLPGSISRYSSKLPNPAVHFSWTERLYRTCATAQSHRTPLNCPILPYSSKLPNPTVLLSWTAQSYRTPLLDCPILPYLRDWLLSSDGCLRAMRSSPGAETNDCCADVDGCSSRSSIARSKRSSCIEKSREKPSTIGFLRFSDFSGSDLNAL